MAILNNDRRKPGERAFRSQAVRPLAMLAQCPVHRATPMRPLDAVARELGVAALWAKDETGRMGLGSFKALGGAFAVARMICDAAGREDPMATGEVTGAMCFVTASAGNHGLSVAAGARVFGARAAIVLPAGAPAAFADRIRATGAEVIEGGSYEQSVAEAIRLADARGWLHLADGSWPGYVARPAMVMEGYIVLAHEAAAAFVEAGEWPSHVILQAGVGGLAAAVAAHVRDHWPEQPQIVVVEPDRAACLQASIAAGEMTEAAGAASIMGRLDCKAASMIAFDALRRDADAFVTITDAEAEAATARLARHGLATTPSGAAGLAGLEALSPGRECRAMIVVSEGPESG